MTDGAVSWLALAFAARAGGERVARGDQRLTGRYACYRVYECGDGRYYSVAALEPKFWRNLCEALERPDLIDHQYSEDLETQRTLETIFRSKSRDEWDKVLVSLDACCEPVLDIDEVPSHPQIVARGMLDRAREGQVPALGEHTEELLREIGL
jgi:crotonobetainyl-CoA:carnitine CoA-transferase CaiB-like acyl-CoA transferase